MHPGPRQWVGMRVAPQVKEKKPEVNSISSQFYLACILARKQRPSLLPSLTLSHFSQNITSSWFSFPPSLSSHSWVLCTPNIYSCQPLVSWLLLFFFLCYFFPLKASFSTLALKRLSMKKKQLNFPPLCLCEKPAPEQAESIFCG